MAMTIKPPHREMRSWCKPVTFRISRNAARVARVVELHMIRRVIGPPKAISRAAGPLGRNASHDVENDSMPAE
jgi:hypothetical protein